MKCSEAERWISFLVDGEALPEENARATHEHISTCSSCRDLLRLEKERASLLSNALGGERSDESRLAAAIASGSFPSGGPSRGPSSRRHSSQGHSSQGHSAAAERPGRFFARRLRFLALRLGPAAWLAAALLAFSVTGAGFWWGSDFFRRAERPVEIAGPLVPAVLVPAAASPVASVGENFSAAAESPFQLRYVEDSWELMPVGDEGVPMGREVHRSRSRILDLPVKNLESPGAQSPRSWMLDVERVDTRYYRLTSWPYD